LQPCSPAINAGNNTFSDSLKIDIEGKKRIFYSKIDIGPYEFQDFKINSFDLKPSFCKSKQGSFTPSFNGACGIPTISWKNENQQSGSGGTNLAVGKYTFFVKDTNNCTDTIKNVSILDKGGMTADFKIVNLSSTPAKDGGIRVLNIGNGKAPYQFLWTTGDTTDIIQNLSVGTYGVSITDANGCLFTASITLKVISSTTEVLEKDILLYPNPTSNWLFLDHKNNIPLGKIQLFDQKGSLLQQFLPNTTQIDLSTLPNALYFLKIQTERNVLLKKVVKQD
jgi:Secretion system C-terminal sorting domain